MKNTPNPDEYIDQHRETLVEIIKHGNDEFVRSLALAALVKYGADPDLERVRREINRAADRRDST